MCVGLPCGVDTRWFCLVESGRFISLVESDDQRADAKRPNTSTLCISLLHPSYILGDVLDCHGILDCQTVTLCF